MEYAGCCVGQIYQHTQQFPQGKWAKLYGGRIGRDQSGSSVESELHEDRYETLGPSWPR